MTHDIDDPSKPDSLRPEGLRGWQEFSTDERLDHLVELVAQLNDRIEALEGHVTTLMAMSVDKGLGH